MRCHPGDALPRPCTTSLRPSRSARRSSEKTVRRIAEEVATQNGGAPGAARPRATCSTAASGRSVDMDGQARGSARPRGATGLDGLVVSAPSVVAQVTGRVVDVVRHFQQNATRMAILDAYLRQRRRRTHQVPPQETRQYWNDASPAGAAVDGQRHDCGGDRVRADSRRAGAGREGSTLELVVSSPSSRRSRCRQNPAQCRRSASTGKSAASFAENTADTGQTSYQKIDRRDAQKRR